MKTSSEACWKWNDTCKGQALHCECVARSGKCYPCNRAVHARYPLDDLLVASCALSVPEILQSVDRQMAPGPENPWRSVDTQVGLLRCTLTRVYKL
eukprot:2913903-Rhodomonas_salina.2